MTLHFALETAVTDPDTDWLLIPIAPMGFGIGNCRLVCVSNTI